MTQIKETVGNIIELAENGDFEVIAQGCNCHCVMGSGLAKDLKNKIPEVFAVDCETVAGDRSKLGTITYTKENPFTVVNCYTQYDKGNNGIYADYDAIEKSLQMLKDTFPGKKIGLPKIGAGRAGGDWDIIKPIIEKIFCDDSDDVTIVYFSEFDAGIPLSKQTHIAAGSIPANTPPPSAGSQGTINSAQAQPKKKKRLKHGNRRVCHVCDIQNLKKDMVSYAPGFYVCNGQCQKDFETHVHDVNTKTLQPAIPVVDPITPVVDPVVS